MKLIRCKKHHRSRSKRRRCSCSEESILTDDEETYEYKSRLKKPCRYVPETPSRERRQIKEWESCENIHFPFECECCPRNYRTHIYKKSSEIPREFITTEPEVTTRRPEMPMVKRYLPMYQTPELIEELKRHDRMKLIQEKERKKQRLGSPFRCLDSSTSSRMETQRINPSLASERSVSVEIIRLNTLLIFIKIKIRIILF